MDNGTVVQVSKRQKMYEGQRNDENEDRISHLPDNVLHYILSFLPTKHAVGTSILATRWRYLWTSIHNFEFSERQVYTGSKSKNYSKRKMLFTNFVDRVLLQSGVSDMKKFSLSCKGCDEAHFDKWISTVTSRKVEELLISIVPYNPPMFINWNFSCKTLRILKIEMSEHMISIPSSVCFPSLKIMHLKLINFSSDPEVEEIILNFPILEELVILYCRWLEIKTVNIVVPTLQMLTIREHYQDISFEGCEIKIDAERLTSLKFVCKLSIYKYSLGNSSSLVEASIDILPEIEHAYLHSFLREISNVRDLELSSSSVETLSNPAVSADVCFLSRLIHLRITGRVPSSGKTLIDLLCILPKLESLIFPDGGNSFTFKGNGRIVGTTSQCFLSQLKLVEFGCFRGVIEKEIWFIKFLLKSIKVGDILTIKLRGQSGNTIEWKDRITRQLEITKYPNCILEFC